MTIKCVVAAMTTDGPGFFACKVECTQSAYDNGEHYELAESAADDNGYDRPMLAFDENDGPDWLFDQFEWDDVEVFAEDDD
jgi:hypothetical protein